MTETDQTLAAMGGPTQELTAQADQPQGTQVLGIPPAQTPGSNNIMDLTDPTDGEQAKQVLVGTPYPPNDALDAKRYRQVRDRGLIHADWIFSFEERQVGPGLVQGEIADAFVDADIARYKNRQ